MTDRDRAKHRDEGRPWRGGGGYIFSRRPDIFK